MSIYHQILRKTGSYSVAVFASRATGFLLVPVYTRYLTPRDYGVMELLDLTVSLLGMLFGARLGQALFYFYFAARSDRDRERCISTAFLGSVLLGGACALLAFSACSLLSSLVFGTAEYASYFRLLLLSFGCSLPVEVGFCCMRTLGQAEGYIRATLCNLFAGVVLNLIFLIGFHMGVRGMLTSSLLASSALAAYMAWYSLSPIRVSLDWPLLFRFFRYSVPLALSSLAVFFIHYGDRAFLRSHISLPELGVYSLAYKIGMAIAYLHMPFALHWNSQVCAIVYGPDGEKIYVRTCTYLTAALTLGVVLLTLFIQPMLPLLVGPGFSGAVPLIPWLAAAYLIRAVGAHLQTAFILVGKPGLEARVNVVGAITCVVAYGFLIPLFKLWGAIAATGLGFLVILVYGFWEAQRARCFSFEYQRLLRIVFFAMFVMGSSYAVRSTDFWIQTGMATLLSSLYLLLLAFGCFDREERTAVVTGLRALVRKAFSQVPTEEVAA